MRKSETHSFGDQELGGWRWSERAVFAALLISAFLWVLGVSSTEVYPAPNLPSFGEVQQVSNEPLTSWEVSIETETGDVIAVPLETMFPDAPNSQLAFLMANIQENPTAPEVSAWFASQAEASAQSCGLRVVLEQFGADPGRWTFDGTCA